MIKFLENYQSLIYKNMSGFEIMKSLNITGKEQLKYRILSIYQDLQNMNIILKLLMTLEGCQYVKNKKYSKRSKRKLLLQRNRYVAYIKAVFLIGNLSMQS